MNVLTHPAYLLLCLAVITGCQSADVPPPAPIAAAETQAHVPARTTGNAIRTAARTPDLADPKVTSAQLVEFKPPFPERADLFEARSGPRTPFAATRNMVSRSS